MAFNLPNPTSPATNDALQSAPIRANFQAIQSFLNSIDGSLIQAGTIQEGALATGIDPRLRGSETLQSFVASGCVWSISSGLAGTMSSGTVYVNGYRTPVGAIASHTFTASKDTYIDIDNNANITYIEVANGASSPSLTANSIRLAKIVTNGSAITTITQDGSLDTNGVTLYPDNSKLKYLYVNKLLTSPIPGGGTFSDVASSSLTFTMSRAGLVVFNFGGNLQVNSNDEAVVALNIDGTNMISAHNFNSTTSVMQESICQWWPQFLSSGSHTVKLQVKCNTNANCAYGSVVGSTGAQTGYWFGIITVQA